MNETIEFANRTWCWHQEALQYSFCPDPNEVPQSTNTGNLYFIHIDTVNIFLPYRLQDNPVLQNIS